MKIITLRDLLANTRLAGDCLLWCGFATPKGYGHAQFESTNQPVHRIHWKLANGTIPKGYHLHHVCSNKLCVNLDHLQLMPASVHGRHHISTMEKARLLALDKKRNRLTCRHGHPWADETTEYVRVGRRCIPCRRKARMDRYYRLKALGIRAA